MNAKSELVTKKESQSAVMPVASPDSLIALGLEKGASLEQIRELYDFKRQWEADEAKKAYMQAITDFKANPPKIFKDKHNKQYGSMYTSIEGLVNSAIPALSKHGLSHRWDSKQDDGLVFVTCILSHVLGHSERVTMSGPPDASGKKNPIQQIKSTRTYLKGETFEAITGLASETFNQSDDGNGASVDLITEDQANEIHAAISENGIDMVKFLAWLRSGMINSIADINVNSYGAVMRQISASIEVRNAKN